MKLSIKAAVGRQAANLTNDVKVIQALLNVLLRQSGRKALVVDGGCGIKTIEAIKDFQQKVVKVAIPDERIDPNGKSFRALFAACETSVKASLPVIKPEVGVVTFDSEGMEGGPYHSRILHVPGEWSGLTIGRGYDMGSKSAVKITTDLLAGGINAKQANVLSKAHGLKGNQARSFIIDNDLLDFYITPVMQLALFNISYEEESKETRRLCERKAYENEYGICNWNKLDTKIKQVMIDLKFRGDYKPSTAKHVQEFVVNNDVQGFKNSMSNRSNWNNVPKDRFDRRVKFLEEH